MVNRNFYPGDCRRQIEDFLTDYRPLDEPPELVAGVVPHAGWEYSGRVAAHVWKALADRARPETVILFGAVHVPGVVENAVYPEGSWETPLGPVEVDAKLSAEIIAESRAVAVARPEAHQEEWALEVEMPFIKALLPKARVVPISVPLICNPVQLGDVLGHLVKDRRVAAIGSSDFTHYGEERFSFAPRGTGAPAHDWMKSNDRRLLGLLEAILPDEIPPEVAAHRNACGAGALAAVTAFARARRAEKGIILDHTTSHEVRPEGEFTSGVGYAGVVF